VPAQLRFAPHTNRIEINYSTVSLAPSASLRFRYKLEGFDSEWQESGQRRQAIYTNLRPGDYVFRLASTNGEGAWDTSETRMAFSIARAFYQTSVFSALCAILASVTIAAAWRFRLRIVKERFRSVLAERVRVAQDLHDTLLQSLVAVALDFDDISAQLDPSAGCLRDQVTRMRERTEHYIQETRLSIWQLRSPLLETGSLVEALRSYGGLATEGSSTTFQCAERGAPIHLAPDIEQQLLRIGQEAIMNAVRHAESESITAELSYEEEHVTLRVSDDGAGFDPVHVGRDGQSHWGLATMNERAESIEATFSIVSHVGAGTTVEVVARAFQG
jgi:signal transduction histidine kinase